MLQSKLFGKTSKTINKEEVSINAQFITRGGFGDKLMAGVYSYLPMGWRVYKKIEKIVREEINAIGGQEVFLPALQPKEIWETTKRWDSFDVLFKVKSQTGHQYAIGPTHEEVIVPLAKKFIQSYKDLPLYLYQIQTKFRDEKRAKSGILRGKEFIMKDLYSFHADQGDLENYYQKVIDAYNKIFTRCGLDAIMTEASGGAFTKKFSHEFQVLTPFGEDTIIYCPKCRFAQNIEVAALKEGDKCAKCSESLKSSKSIEVGNIFDLGTKFSNDFNLIYTNKKGEEKPVIMGCYGIGLSRLLGAIVEVLHDDKGIIWPKSVAPFEVHLLKIGENTDVAKAAVKVYEELTKNNIDVLFDDREITAGEKLTDADLIGIPVRLIVSDKTKDKIELKFRDQKEIKLLELSKAIQIIKDTYQLN